MIVMDIKLDNFMAFDEFHMNMSYPKKIVNSCLNEEHLLGFPNFRYKKINIIMGTNASGKTSLGLMLMAIFNFIKKRDTSQIISKINDVNREASFTIDIVLNTEYYDNPILYRFSTIFADSSNKHDIKKTEVKKIAISRNERYEFYSEKLEDIEPEILNEKSSIMFGVGWLFSYPLDSLANEKYSTLKDSENYVKVLNNILCSLDNSIIGVEKSEEVENSYLIKKKDKTIIMQDGEIALDHLLSSGTKAGIGVADMITAILESRNGFYYCDEKFSYIQSDIEKACLSLMIQSIKASEQLFFTTHNLDILDLPLPKHSFMFLKKHKMGDDIKIEYISASDFLKKNTDSLRNAVDNDLFSVAPNLDLIYELEMLNDEKDD